MHPVIRVVILILLAGCMPFAAPVVLLATFGALLLLTMAMGSLADWFRTSMRLRWLFLSILVLYLAFTPGEPLFVHDWLPMISKQGLETAILRCLVLIILIGVVRLVMARTPRDELVGALLWLGRPLAWIGLPQQRLAVRIGLAFESVAQLQDDLAVSVRSKQSEIKGLRARLAALAETSAGVLTDIESSAAAADAQTMGVRWDAPPAAHWLYVVAVIAALYGLQVYGVDGLG